MWQGVVIGLAAALVAYALFVIWLAAAGRRDEARAVARLVPDLVVLVRRLLSDPRVPKRRKLALAALVPYLALPFDLVPDFIPVAGYADDVVLVALVLRHVLRGSGPGPIVEHWPGPRSSLVLVLRLAGYHEPPVDTGRARLGA